MSDASHSQTQKAIFIAGMSLRCSQKLVSTPPAVRLRGPRIASPKEMSLLYTVDISTAALTSASPQHESAGFATPAKKKN